MQDGFNLLIKDIRLPSEGTKKARGNELLTERINSPLICRPERFHLRIGFAELSLDLTSGREGAEGSRSFQTYLKILAPA